jgi:hypothetical protein
MSNVFKIADRCGDNVERSRHERILALQAVASEVREREKANFS